MAQDIFQSTQHIATLLLGNPEENNIREVASGSVGVSLGIQYGARRARTWKKRRSTCSSFRPRWNLQLFPQSMRHQRAEAMSISSRSDFRKWADRQERNDSQALGSTCGSLIESISAAFSKEFRRVGQCGYPLCANPVTAMDMIDMWRMVRMRRIEVKRWELALPSDLQTNDDPNLRIPRSVVAGNIDRARRRW